MVARRWLAVLVTGAFITPLAFVAGLAAEDHANPPAHAADFGGSGEFHPLDARRLVDTRHSPGTGTQVSGARRFNTTFNVKVAGATAMGGGATPPATGVQSVLLNITVLDPWLRGWVGVVPAGRPGPGRSMMETMPGRDSNNLVIVQPGAGGAVTVTIKASGASGVTGWLHVMVDVVGWFGTTSAPRGDRLVPVLPGRALDTRYGWGTRKGLVGTGQSVGMVARGADTVGPSRADVVPNSSAVSAVLMNLTTVSPYADTSVVASRSGATGVVSATTVQKGRVSTNLVVVPIGSDGAIRFSNAAGAVHLIGDIVGYFIRGTPSTSRTGRTLPLSTPFPAIDTRTPPTVGKLAGRVQETWDFTPFVSSVRASGAAAGAENGAWVNLAAFNLTTAYGTPPPSTTLTMYTNTPSVLSTALSLRRGEVTRSTTVIPYGGGNRVNVYNSAGFVDYALDVMAVILR